jgi:sialic acid synthase SpsE
MLKKLELSEEDHDELITYCGVERKIEFLSTAHSIFQSISLLVDKGIKIGKIPSGKLPTFPTWRRWP